MVFQIWKKGEKDERERVDLARRGNPTKRPWLVRVYGMLGCLVITLALIGLMVVLQKILPGASDMNFQASLKGAFDFGEDFGQAKAVLLGSNDSILPLATSNIQIFTPIFLPVTSPPSISIPTFGPICIASSVSCTTSQIIAKAKRQVETICSTDYLVTPCAQAPTVPLISSTIGLGITTTVPPSITPPPTTLPPTTTTATIQGDSCVTTLVTCPEFRRDVFFRRQVNQVCSTTFVTAESCIDSVSSTSSSSPTSTLVTPSTTVPSTTPNVESDPCITSLVSCPEFRRDIFFRRRQEDTDCSTTFITAESCLATSSSTSTIFSPTSSSMTPSTTISSTTQTVESDPCITSIVSCPEFRRDIFFRRRQEETECSTTIVTAESCLTVTTSSSTTFSPTSSSGEPSTTISSTTTSVPDSSCVTSIVSCPQFRRDIFFRRQINTECSTTFMTAESCSPLTSSPPVSTTSTTSSVTTTLPSDPCITSTVSCPDPIGKRQFNTDCSTSFFTVSSCLTSSLAPPSSTQPQPPSSSIPSDPCVTSVVACPSDEDRERFDIDCSTLLLTASSCLTTSTDVPSSTQSSSTKSSSPPTLISSEPCITSTVFCFSDEDRELDCSTSFFTVSSCISSISSISTTISSSTSSQTSSTGSRPSASSSSSVQITTTSSSSLQTSSTSSLPSSTIEISSTLSPLESSISPLTSSTSTTSSRPSLNLIVAATSNVQTTSSFTGTTITSSPSSPPISLDPCFTSTLFCPPVQIGKRQDDCVNIFFSISGCGTTTESSTSTSSSSSISPSLYSSSSSQSVPSSATSQFLSSLPSSVSLSSTTNPASSTTLPPSILNIASSTLSSSTITFVSSTQPSQPVSSPASSSIISPAASISSGTSLGLQRIVLSSSLPSVASSDVSSSSSATVSSESSSSSSLSTSPLSSLPVKLLSSATTSDSALSSTPISSDTIVSLPSSLSPISQTTPSLQPTSNSISYFPTISISSLTTQTTSVPSTESQSPTSVSTTALSSSKLLQSDLSATSATTAATSTSVPTNHNNTNIPSTVSPPSIYPLSQIIPGNYIPIALSRLFIGILIPLYNYVLHFEPIWLLTSTDGAPLSAIAGSPGTALPIYIGYFLLQVGSAFSAGVLVVDSGYCDSDIPPSLCPPRLSRNPPIIIFIMIVLIIQVIVLLYLIVKWFKRPSTISADPLSIAGVAVMMGHPVIEEDFASYPSEMNATELKRRLKGSKYKLGTFFTASGVEKFGIMPAESVATPFSMDDQAEEVKKQGFWNTLGDKWMMLKIRRGIGNDRGGGNWKRKKGYANAAFAVLLLTLVGLTITALVKVGHEDDVFLITTVAHGTAFRIFLAGLGIIVTWYWGRLFQDVQVLTPYTELGRGGADPRHTITLNKHSFPLTAFFPLTYRSHYTAAAVALTGILSEFLTIALCGIPYRPGQGRPEFLFFCILALIILVSMLGLLVYTSVWLRNKLPELVRPPDNIARVMTLVAGTGLVRDLEGMSAMGTRERNERIKEMGKTYAYGWRREGEGGRVRWVVDEVEEKDEFSERLMEGR